MKNVLIALTLSLFGLFVQNVEAQVMPAIPSHTILGNSTGSTAAPSPITALPSGVTTTGGQTPVGTNCTTGCAAGQVAVLTSSTGNVVSGAASPDLLNVKNYGAVCDGSTDDTAHLVSALTAAGATGTLQIQCPMYIATPSSITQQAGSTLSFIGNGSLKLGVGSISSIYVVNPGSGYTGTYTASLSSGAGTLGTVALKMVSVAVASGGTGCQVGDTLYISGGTQLLGASVIVQQLSAGAVSSVSLQAPGAYNPPPTNPVSTTNASGAHCTGQPTLTIAWGIQSIAVSSAGTYSGTTLPTVTISGTAPTTSAYVIAQGQPITLNGNISAGNQQVFTGAVNIAGSPQNPWLNLKWVATGNGSTDDTAAVQSFALTGKNIYAPTGTYLLSNQVDWTTSGQYLHGDGRISSVFTVASVPTNSVAGYFYIAPTNAPALSLNVTDVGMQFTQPDTSAYSSLTAYPPAIYQGGQGGYYERVRLTACMDGIVMPYGDRTTIADLEASCFHITIKNLDSYDVIRLSRDQFWEFGLTANQGTLYVNKSLSNAATDISGSPQLPVALYSEHADGLEIIGGFAQGGTHLVFRPSTTSSSPVPFTTLNSNDFNCDITTCIDMSAGVVTFFGGEMGQFTASYAVKHTGGKLTISGGYIGTGGASNPNTATIYSNSSSTTDYVNITGEMFDAQTNDYANTFDFNSIDAVGSAAINVTSSSFLRSSTVAETNPIILTTSGSMVNVTNNIFTPPTTGSGAAINVSGATTSCVNANSALGRAVTQTSTSCNVTYGGPALFNGGAGGAGSKSAVVAAINGTGAGIAIGDAGAGSDFKYWDWSIIDASHMGLRAVNDAANNANYVMYCTRNGFQVTACQFGNSTNNTAISFPGTGGVTSGGTIGTGAYTISGLPTCNSGAAGLFAYVTNGVASPTYYGTVSTTGTTNDPVFCNGSNWVYH